MKLNTALRKTIACVDISQPVQKAVCQHRLAQLAARYEREDGKILNPAPRQRAWFLPTQAAAPVLPFTAGTRSTGWRAAMSRGASTSISIYRVDGPLLALFYFVYLKPITHLLPTRAQDPRANPEAPRHALYRAGDLARFACLVTFALCCWEIVLGTRQDEQPEIERLCPEFAWFDKFRRLGVLGYTRLALNKAAENAAELGHTKREGLYLGVRLAIEVTLQIPLLMTAAAVGCIGAVGAMLGVAHECLMRMKIAFEKDRLGREGRMAEVVPIGDLQRRQAQAQWQAFNDEELPAPIINAFWQRDMARNAMNDNGYVHYAVQTLPFVRLLHRTPYGQVWPDHNREARIHVAFENFRRAQHLFGFAGAQANDFWAANANRPQAQQAPQAQAFREGQNVHGIGRDARTRAAMLILLERTPRLDIDYHIRDLRSFIDRSRRQALPTTTRRHASGLQTGAVALQALDGSGARMQLFKPILARDNTWFIDNNHTLTMTEACARIWQAIATIEPNPADEIPRDRLHQERREAFLVALADGITADGQHVCAPGQGQRLMMVLNQQLPGIVIEHYDRIAPVPQFVTAKTYAMDAALGENPSAQAIKQAFDQAYQEGCAIYQDGARETLADQLRAIADLNYDTAWVPPRLGA